MPFIIHKKNEIFHKAKSRYKLKQRLFRFI